MKDKHRDEHRDEQRDTDQVIEIMESVTPAQDLNEEQRIAFALGKLIRESSQHDLPSASPELREMLMRELASNSVSAETTAESDSSNETALSCLEQPAPVKNSIKVYQSGQLSLWRLVRTPRAVAPLAVAASLALVAVAFSWLNRTEITPHQSADGTFVKYQVEKSRPDDAQTVLNNLIATYEDQLEDQYRNDSQEVATLLRTVQEEFGQDYKRLCGEHRQLLQEFAGVVVAEKSANVFEAQVRDIGKIIEAAKMKISKLDLKKQRAVKAVNQGEEAIKGHLFKLRLNGVIHDVSSNSSEQRSTDEDIALAVAELKNSGFIERLGEGHPEVKALRETIGKFEKLRRQKGNGLAVGRALQPDQILQLYIESLDEEMDGLKATIKSNIPLYQAAFKEAQRTAGIELDIKAVEKQMDQTLEFVRIAEKRLIELEMETQDERDSQEVATLLRTVHEEFGQDYKRLNKEHRSLLRRIGISGGVVTEGGVNVFEVQVREIGKILDTAKMNIQKLDFKKRRAEIALKQGEEAVRGHLFKLKQAAVIHEGFDGSAQQRTDKSSTLTTTIDLRISELTVELAGLLKRLGEGHPQTQTLKETIKSWEKLRSDQGAEAVGSVFDSKMKPDQILRLYVESLDDKIADLQATIKVNAPRYREAFKEAQRIAAIELDIEAVEKQMRQTLEFIRIAEKRLVELNRKKSTDINSRKRKK